jgi:hypothetical protein
MVEANFVAKCHDYLALLDTHSSQQEQSKIGKIP